MKIDKVELLFLLITILITSVYSQDETDAIDTATEEDDVELRIDFSSGSVIANEAPKVLKPIPDATVPMGTGDTILADLNDVFSDAESGSALEFKVSGADPELIINTVINEEDSTLKVIIQPQKEGECNLVISASDGSKEAHDTVKVLVKQKFKLPARLGNRVYKSADTVVTERVDISHVLPLEEDYSYTVSSTDESIIKAYADESDNMIRLEIADSSFGTVLVILTVADKDLLTERDTLRVLVKRSFRVKDYERKVVGFNPGFGIYTTHYFSGISARVWLKDRVAGGLSGYYQWDEDGIGGSIDLYFKPSISFPLQPGGKVAIGFHRQTVRQVIEDVNVTIEKDLAVLTMRAALCLDAWIGKRKRVVLGLEAGYTYGTKEYPTISVTDYGSNNSETTIEKFNMPPLHLRINAQIYLRKL